MDLLLLLGGLMSPARLSSPKAALMSSSLNRPTSAPVAPGPAGKGAGAGCERGLVHALWHSCNQAQMQGEGESSPAVNPPALLSPQNAEPRTHGAALVAQVQQALDQLRRGGHHRRGPRVRR